MATRKIETFECDGRQVGVSLPEGKKELQLIFVQGERQLVVCLPPDARLGFAMSLLEADGMSARVQLTKPSPPCTVCGMPVPPLRGEVRTVHKKCLAARVKS